MSKAQEAVINFDLNTPLGVRLALHGIQVGWAGDEVCLIRNRTVVTTIWVSSSRQVAHGGTFRAWTGNRDAPENFDSLEDALEMVLQSDIGDGR